MTDVRAGEHQRALRGPLVFAGVLIVIAGLVGMHGLGSHGAGLAGHVIGSVHGSAGMAATRAVATDAMPLVDLGTTEVAPLAVPGVGGGSNSLADLCLAVLLLVGFVLILALSRRSALRRVRMSGSCRAGLMPPRVNGPDPPSLAELSLLRC